MSNPLVSIITLTYNHEPYIKECIEGILMQKTNFPYEIIIAEDCSKDGTREIVYEYIRKYPEIIRLVTSGENVGAQKNSIRGINNCKGKYIAFCEGDDYWIDPYKLQKQVKYLEKNPDYAMVHTNAMTLDNKSGCLMVNDTSSILSGMIFQNLLFHDFYIKTLTVMGKKEVICEAMKELNSDGFFLSLQLGDYPMWLEIAKKYKIGYINEVTATYRVLEESLSRSRSKWKNVNFSKSIYDVKIYFCEKYHLRTCDRLSFEQRYFRENILYFLLGRKYLDFVQFQEDSVITKMSGNYFEKVVLSLLKRKFCFSSMSFLMKNIRMSVL